MKNTRMLVVLWSALVLAAPAAAASEPQPSSRLVHAKDYIADEQWERAIEQLRAAIGDTKERNKDEALFWLAHSEHQVRDYKAGLESILMLEKQYPRSPWVKAAQSLRIEIAQKLRATDVLWFTVRPDGAATARGQWTPPTPSTTTKSPAGEERTTPRPSGRTSHTTLVREGSAVREGTVTVSPSSTFWFSEGWRTDGQQRMLALGSLMQTDAPKVIPILKEIALESPDPNEASRAVFVLAQSGRPEAYTTVLEVVHQGNESVQIAAVRQLGRFGGPKMADELLKVYTTSNPRVKYQVVNALGERRATAALMQILQRESDRRLQETAIVRLGQAGGRQQLRIYYDKAAPELKRPIINGLFNAGAEDELLAIAQREPDESVRREAVSRLSLLNSVKARALVEKEQQNR